MPKKNPTATKVRYIMMLYFAAIISLVSAIVGGGIAGATIIYQEYSTTAGILGLLAALIGTYTFGSVVGYFIGKYTG